MLNNEIKERNIDLERKKEQKQQKKKTLLKWIVSCEVVHSRNTTSFSLLLISYLTHSPLRVVNVFFQKNTGYTFYFDVFFYIKKFKVKIKKHIQSSN
jgi:hypothetical protein